MCGVAYKTASGETISELKLPVALIYMAKFSRS